MQWQLDQALELIRLLQPETRKFGFHLTLGGGVLNAGRSDKDLDLYFLPLCNKDIVVDPDGMLKYLQMLWGEGEPIQPGRSTTWTLEADRPEYEDNPEGTFYKFRQKFMFGGNQRIDAFILAYSPASNEAGMGSAELVTYSDIERSSEPAWRSQPISLYGAEYWYNRTPSEYLGISREPQPNDPRNRFASRIDGEFGNAVGAAARERQRQEQIATYERMRNYINESMPVSWDIETSQQGQAQAPDPDPGDSDDSPF